MINNLVRLYYLGWVAYSTREAWLPPHVTEHLLHDLMLGLFYGACGPGIVLSMVVKGPAAVVIGGGSLAFWLLLLGFQKMTERQPRPVGLSQPAAAAPFFEGFTRKRTYYIEEE